MRTKTILVALTATLLLAFAAGAAIALRSFSVSETSTSIKIPNFLFQEEAGSALTAEVTLNRMISSAWPKRTGVLIGAVTGVRIENCRGPFGGCRWRVLLEANNSTPCGESARLCAVNWRLFYLSFIGTLPNPMQLEDTFEFFFLFESPLLGLACLYSGEAVLFYNLEVRGGIINGQAIERTTVPLHTGLSGSCARTVRFRSNFGAPSPAITVRLI